MLRSGRFGTEGQFSTVLCSTVGFLRSVSYALSFMNCEYSLVLTKHGRAKATHTNESRVATRGVGLGWLPITHELGARILASGRRGTCVRRGF